MDVDEDEDATQRPKKVQDFGIEVDFEILDDDARDNGTVERFDKEILRLNADIERMAPNLKATERSVSPPFLFCLFTILMDEFQARRCRSKTSRD